MRQNIVQIDTGECDFDKAKGTFVSSKAVGGNFPRRIALKSLRTGRVVEFKTIGEDHPKFCHDGWDGEMQVYEPSIPVPGVTTLTVSHMY
jgi:hypothetical protein